MKTFIAVDQQDMLENIKSGLEGTHHFEVIGNANNGTDCLNYLNQKKM